MLNEAIARNLFPAGGAAGQCVFIPTDCYRVVGVVESSRSGLLLRRQTDSEFYVPFVPGGEQVPQILLVRTGSAHFARAAVATAVRSVSSNLPYINIRTLDELVGAEAQSWRMGAALFGLFGGLAALLAGVGIYAALAFSVRARTAEIGIRMALGASPRDIVSIVVRHALAVLVVGWCVGTIAAWSVSGAIASVLFSVARADVRSFVAASAVIALACVSGCVIPAVRAARTNPAVTLRHD